MMPKGALQPQTEIRPADLRELIAAPADRRVMLHVVQEVRRHHKVTVRFGFSLEPDADAVKDQKAGLISVRFISTTQTILPPSDKQFRESERYGHFVYFGTTNGLEYGEFEREFMVPYHANRFVVTLLPFSNSSTRISAFSIVVEPSTEENR
jgi:hypothetical protein